MSYVATATAEVRPHNFKRQETLERAQLRHLTPIVEAIGHRITGSLTSMLHAAVRVESGEIRQDSWDNLAAEVPEHTFLTSSVLAPSGTRILLHVPLPMAMSLVELRLGGTGRGEAPDRPLTDIEQRLVDEVARLMLADVVVALEPTLPVHVTATTSVSNIMYVQMPNASDTWLLIPIAVEIGEDATLEAGLWIPSGLASALLAAVGRDESSADASPDAGTLARVRHRVFEATVEVGVRFPDIALSTQELLSLAPGDVVPLHRQQGLPLHLTIEGTWHHDVVPTVRGRRLACTIVAPSIQENM